MNIINKTYLDNLTDTFCGRRDMTRRFSNQCLGEVLSVNIERLNGRKNPSPLVVLVMHGLYINLDLSCNQTCVHIKFIVNEGRILLKTGYFWCILSSKVQHLCQLNLLLLFRLTIWLSTKAPSYKATSAARCVPRWR